MRAIILCAIVASVTSCYRPSPSPGGPCGPDGECPSSLRCVAGVCVDPGDLDPSSIDASAIDPPIIDGPKLDEPPTPDAATPDAATPDAAMMPLQPITITPPPFTTTSTSFVDVPGGTLTIPPSLGTSWLLVLSASLRGLAVTTTDQVTVEARYRVDGIEQGMGGTQNSAADLPGPWEHLYVIDGALTSRQVVFQLREATGAMATIDKLHAIAIPLPVGSFHYRSADPIKPVTAQTNPAELVSLSFGALSGDYVFLMMVNGTEAPGTDVYLQWHGPSGGPPWMDTSQNSRKPWQSYLMVQRETVNNANATVKLFAATKNATGANVQYVRVVALAASAFPVVDFVRNGTQLLNSTTTPTTTTTLTPSPGTASAYLYLGLQRLQDDCNALADAHRTAHVFIDGVDVAGTSHATDNCAYEAMYGTARLLATKPAQIRTAFSSANGQAVEHDLSAQLLLGLP